MSNLVKLLYDTAALRAEYQQLHRLLFGLSARRLLELAIRPQTDRRDLALRELARLNERLRQLRAECETLGQDACGIRRGPEIRQALEDYLQALAKTFAALQALCVPEDDPNGSGSPPPASRQTRLVGYDDAVQYQQRLGARLNDLIASL